MRALARLPDGIVLAQWLLMKKRMSISDMRFSNGTGVLLAFGVRSFAISASSSDEKHRHDKCEGRTDHQDVNGSCQFHVFLLSQPVSFMSKMCLLESKFDAAMRRRIGTLIHEAAVWH